MRKRKRENVRLPFGRRLTIPAILSGAALIAVLALVSPMVVATHQPALANQDFTPTGAQGFGDRDNSWTWSMRWWRGHLYAGTNRAYRCASGWMLHIAFPALIPYPPDDPDLECAEHGADLPMQAEIWRWTPETDSWERVFQSPNDVPNPDVPGAFLPRDLGFRTMTVHTDPDGTEALYAASVTTQAMWRGTVPRPRILRSTDGTTFTPIPFDDPEKLPSASFRSLTSHDGKLFVLHGPIQGNGDILAAVDEAGNPTDPTAGNEAWRQVSPGDLKFFELVSFNGSLYAGGIDPSGGYSVVKAQTAGPPPYNFETVVAQGAHLTPRPSKAVVSMHVFDDRLYVGTADPSEIIRINPDDTWELVVGPPRETPDGWKYPLSGLDDGFGNHFNDHIWRMQGHDGRLYVGTYDSSIVSKDHALIGSQIQHLFGFDLYHSDEGWYFAASTTSGFADRFGDDFRFHFGIRSFADTPHGLFVGSTNDFYGLQVFRGVAGAERALSPPARLEAEVTTDRRPLLSWEPVPQAVQYRISRAPLRMVTAQFQETWFPDPHVEIATTRNTTFVDDPIDDDKYLYFVTAENADGNLSESSNVVQLQLPVLRPPETFSSLFAAVDRLEQRGRFVSSEEAATTRGSLEQAQAEAEQGGLAAAFDELQVLQARILSGSVTQSPDSSDLEVQVAKLLRRLKLAHHELIDQATLF